MNNQIDAKSYGPDSTKAEIKALQNRIWLHEPDVVYLKEVPVQSEFQIEIFFNQIQTLVDKRYNFYIIIDLCEARRPPAVIRAYLQKRFRSFKDQIGYTAVFTGKNFLLNIAAKFVLGRVFDPDNFSVHTSLEQAENAIKQFRENGA